MAAQWAPAHASRVRRTPPVGAWFDRDVDPTTRLVTVDDAAKLARLQREHRDFLAPWEPLRPEEYFTAEGQRIQIAANLERHARGECEPRVVLDERGAVVGQVTLHAIVRGALQSSTLGYWLSPTVGGRGLATRAVADVVRLAFDDLGLHRLEAGTLIHNVRSQRVLEKNGFVRFGLAPRLLRIAGQWQDHVLFQLLNDDWREPA